jgi:hypothetical protein
VWKETEKLRDLTKKQVVALKQLEDFEKEHGSTGDNAVEVMGRKSVNEG